MFKEGGSRSTSSCQTVLFYVAKYQHSSKAQPAVDQSTVEINNAVG